jgi:RNA polymerase sigma-70 factor (ECF subfamily)
MTLNPKAASARETNLDAGDKDLSVYGDLDNERRIVSLCQVGDREGQRQMYERFHSTVYRLMARMVGPQDAADLTQQVFLQVFRKVGQFQHGSQFRTWLYRLAINQALQFRRGAARHPIFPLPVITADRSVDHTNLIEQRDLLEVAMGHISPELLAVFTLKEVERLSYREIAETLEVPEGTVASRLNRARSELKSVLIQLSWEP